MEEIDIIELLKRVKEGKAPKEIQIETTNYTFTGIEPIEKLYANENGADWINSIDIGMYTKIKILDKPIIEELRKVEPFDDNRALIIENRNKLNEIIKKINNKE